MLISRKGCFLIVNAVMVFCLLLSITDFPLASLVQKAKFLYLGYCMVDIALRRQKPANNIVLAIMFIFLFYAIVWGYVFDNSHVAIWNAEHRKTMMMFIPMLFCTVFELNAYRCEDEYLLTSGIALALVLFVQTILHISEFPFNPISVIMGMVTDNRLKASFGFMHVNFTGNTCFVALVCLFMSSHIVSSNDLFHSKKKIIIFLIEFLLWMIFLATTCRTALIATFMYLIGKGMISIYQSERLTRGSKILYITIVVGSILFVLALTFIGGFWDYVWSHSNRSLNVSENLKWVGVIGSKWTGMGYVDNQCYYRDELAGGVGGFGVATSSLDMNYLFIYCSTGILGSILFGSMTVLMGVGIFLNRKQKNGVIYILLYLIIVFYAYWETVLFTYRFWAMLVLNSLLLYACNGEMKQGQTVENKAPSFAFLHRKQQVSLE